MQSVSCSLLASKWQLVNKKEWNNAICSNMSTTRDDHTKWSQKEKNIIYHLSVEFKTWHKWTYLQNRNRIREIENWLVVAKGEGVWGEMGWKVGVKSFELLCTEWINKFLLYSTENYSQYPMVNQNGKEYILKHVYVCVTESLCCVAEINTTL